MANESEIVAIITSSRVSDVSPSLTVRQRWRNVPLHERCSMADMIVLKNAFQEAPQHKLLPGQFRELLRTQFNLEYDDEEFNILFLKINTNRNGEMEWDELVSHLLLGYFTNDPENQRASLQLAIMGRPTIMRSQHRHPISKICFCPDVAKDRSTTPMLGEYITASRDGQLNWWTLDMAMLRTAYSSSPVLKVRSTWVTDCVCLPDVNMLVTSSTERDLRFYDITAKTFTLKIVITSWEYMICTMYYYFQKDINEKCILILGDVGGYVRVLQFSPIERGPFRNEAGKPLQTVRHIDLQRKRALPELSLIEKGRIHTDWVRQVSYYSPLHCLVSCATCPDALLMCDLQGSKTHNMFHVDKGIQCFAFDEEAHVLVTGGPDCTVRVWSPFVPATPNLVLQGHHAGIVALVLQNSGQTIYSLARDRVIKVWDVQGQNCVQTYIDVPSEIGERTPISAVYNTATREFILAAIKIAVLVLDEQLNTNHTDGFTHSRAIAKVLYNPLFKVVITCGLDSIIINWNPLTGKRNVMVRDAHTRLLHGEQIPVEITAACFDPGYQLLCTGARDGSIKTWNFNTGLCLKTLTIEYMCEVTGVFWVEGRIMAIGWNRHVTEFEDTGTDTKGKSWETRHSEDVLAAAARMPLSLATSSYNSEMILWKLETGQPYRMFSCTEPMLRIKMQFNKRDLNRSSSPGGAGAKRHSSSAYRPSSMSGRGVDTAAAVQKARARRVSTVSLPQRAQAMRHLAVHAMVFLETRPVHMRVASLMLSIENGMVQAWSDHSAGGFQGSFQAVHTAGDYVSALATDSQNNYLFTGTTVGYIKTWLMTNYLVNKEVHVNMPALRLEFPFLWRDRIEGRAKRCVRDQPLPLLLNSYRGHVRCVTTLAYIDEYKLLLSGSSDYSVRVWRLSGEYLQTLGSFKPWNLDVTSVPPDVKKVASFTTMKVFRSGYVSRYVPGQIEIDKLRDITERELRTGTFGAPCADPLLGHHFKLPRRPEPQQRIVLDDSLPTIPLYAHLRMASTTPIRRPPTPELVRATRLRRAAAAGKKAHFGSTSMEAPQRMSTEKRPEN
ncbi:WD repeat-containing protein on Y chromosome-like [Cydia amplana]|uniref:WD repeat-containing protein on Y chromosome-like n=1 Tax=Cydia amplana TaxID=1869771 RepID=UPI002FE65702